MARKRGAPDWEKFLGSKIYNYENYEGLEDENAAFGQQTAEPVFYEVYLISEEETPLDFLSFTLQNFFNKDEDEFDINLLNLDKNLEIFCGFFTKEVAETKVVEVIECARSNKFDLKCIMRRGIDVSKKS